MHTFHRQPRILLITGDQLRHRYAAHALARQTDLLGIVSETKARIIKQPEKLPAEDQQVIQQHFAERDEAERRHLGEIPAFPTVDLLRVATGESNSASTIEWVYQRRPDLIVLYGSSIIKPPLLEAFFDRVINIHLGLSPYYRGSGTNFWPLVVDEPECVGATLHLAVSKVDAGPILAQVRPDVTPGDRAHDLGTKTIVGGFAAMPAVLRDWHADAMEAVPQNLPQGRLYRRRDFTADAVRQMWRNLDNGMIDRYLASRETRCRRFPIVGNGSQPAGTADASGRPAVCVRRVGLERPAQGRGEV